MAATVSLYDKANLLSRLSTHFFWPLMKRCTKEIPTTDGLESELFEVIKTQKGYHKFTAIWDARVAPILGAMDGTNTEIQVSQYLLFWTILWVHRWRWIPLVFLSLITSLVKFVPPYLLGKVLDYLQETDSKEHARPPLVYGMTLVAGMALSSISYALLTSYSRIIQLMVTAEIRATLAAMVFRKALRLSPGARQMSSTGEILNHMSKDAEEWMDGVRYLILLLSITLEITFALALLYRTIGFAALGTIIGIAIILPLHIVRAKKYSRLIGTKMHFMDERVRRITEVLSSIKVVKLYGWEEAYLARIRSIRESELGILMYLGYFFAIMSLIFISAPSILSLITFGFYALWGGPGRTPGVFTPKIVFVSLTIFNMLRNPISNLSHATTCTIDIIIAMKRVQRFLLREELDPQQINRIEALPSEGTPMISIRQATFSWHGDRMKPCVAGEPGTALSINGGDGDDPSEHQRLLESTSEDDTLNTWATQPTLEDITLDIECAQLTAIVGRIGQGKSSLLSAILGEMYMWKGKVTMYGRSVAYVPQQAWIINATVRDNILFGRPFDANRYKQVIAACALLPDLTMLPAGDQTEIGERGINLSGGQKQRVALARAAYADADVYLLDDPLSAVDAHVEKLLWNRLIGPKGLLCSKTRVLVTHGIHRLRYMDRIVVLKDGKVAEHGTYVSLMDRQRMLYQLIKEYSVTERMKRQKSGSLDGTDGESLEGDASNTGINLDSVNDSDDNSDQNGSEFAGEGAYDAVDADTDETVTSGMDESEVSEDEDLGDKDQQMKQDTEAELIKKELHRTGEVGFGVAMVYLRALSFRLFGLVAFLHVLAHLCNISSTLWLKRWSLESPKGDFRSEDPQTISISRLLWVYAVLSLSNVGLFIVIQTVMFAFASVRASRIIHDRLLKRVLRLPMSFFDTTPLGRVLNRFSSDMQTVDDRVPWRYIDLVNDGLSALATVVIVLLSTPIVAVILPCLLLGLYIIQWYYVRSAAVLKRLYTIAKSPLYSHFTEVLGGVSTIRAMKVQPQCLAENQKLVKNHSVAWIVYSYSNRWLEVHVQLLSALLGLAVSAAAVYERDKMDAGMVGLSMAFVLTWTEQVAWVVRIYGDLQNYLVGLERIQEFCELPVEAPARIEGEARECRALLQQQQQQQAWPRSGQLAFRHYSTRYREGTDLVLRDVSFEVQSGQKVGIVGRTGAGKSSLTLALFRIIEAANSHLATRLSSCSDSRGGSDSLADDHSRSPRHPDELIDGGMIEIDGVDISTVGLDDLRQNLAIIPQDPVLFAGTVRENLDPFGEHVDADLWEALERASLKTTVQALPGGLSFEVAAQGENFSVGQRSLLCLARALLRQRRAKILVLDEATSSVDVETDELIQQTIRTEFREHTVLTIAHRIKTVMDYDRILVLDQGRVCEFDAPQVLLQNRDSMFYQLALQAGEVQE
ncbi:Multidrug resistance-associated protein 1 [Actinomortierella wolfii]|nr:Multidrug resistance-associated protein 1 [Actinomortierella wolfii]